MCGIAGILCREPPGAERKASLLAMERCLRHRGPDDQGTFISSCRRVGFAHTRLSVLDLSPAGHQPMSTPDGRFTITFNGEIYNYRELRRELESEGEVFVTGTDTEVILRMFAR